MTEDTYKYKQFVARMKLSTYKKIRRCFPALKGESASSYFERLAVYIDDIMMEIKMADYWEKHKYDRT